MKTHEIKILRDFADAVYSGDKTFEIRKNDRGYQKGDMVVFKAMEDLLSMPNHPINKTKYMITYVLNGWGIKEDYVVLGIKKVMEANEAKVLDKIRAEMEDITIINQDDERIYQQIKAIVDKYRAEREE